MPPAREGRAKVAGRIFAVAVACSVVTAAPEDEPLRVVSLVPSASALIVELGAAESIVGRAEDDRTPQIADVAVVGTVLRPSPEALRAADPDLVLLPPHVPLAGLETVLPSRVDLQTVRLERLSDVLREVRALGARLGVSGEAGRLAARVERSIAAIGPWPRGCARPVVVWAAGLEPPVVAGGSTLPDDLLRTVGARNAFAGLTGWARPGLEALVGAGADIIVWPVGPELGAPEEAARSPTWRRLPGVRAERVIALDADLVHEAGPRVAGAARAVADALRADCRGPAPPAHAIAPPALRPPPSFASARR